MAPFQRQPTPFEAAVTSQPMFGGAREPQMFNPMNFGNIGGGMGGVAAQMIIPMVAQNFMGQFGQVPSQFLPTQNLFDQFTAQQYHAQQQQAMAMASQRDRLALAQTMRGGLAMMQGKAPSFAQQMQIYGAADQVQSLLPTLSMFLGPETIDAMFGSRGSAAILSQAVHRGSRMSRDPLSGRVGFSGQSAGEVSNEIFENLFGQGADISRMRGLSAGTTGLLYEQLQLRGMAGPSLGAMSPEARMRLLSRASFSEMEQTRAAEASLRARGMDNITEDDIKAARARMFEGPQSTMGRIRRAEGRPGGIRGMSPEDLEALRGEEGVDQMLTTAQAQRITSRLENLAGAVSAMRDIFGDMGRPNAPMQEIINGLEALTQGGLAQMTPGRAEQMVRLTKNLADQSGLGLQGMLGLQAQAAGLADQLGLDRAAAVKATQGAAAFAGAARDTMRLDIPTFGGLTAEQATLLDQQMRVQAQGSQTGNMMNAAVRMLQEGLVDADSEAGRLATAIMRGDTQFRGADGKMRSVHMRNAEFVETMKRSGVSGVAAESVITDTFMNQQYGLEFNTGELARRVQREVDIEPRIGTTFANAIGMQMQQGGMAQALRDQGMTDDEIGDATGRIGQEMARRFFRMDAETLRDTNARNKFMAEQVREVIADDIRRQGEAAGLNEGQIQARIKAAQDNLTDDQARQFGVTMMSQLGRQIHNDPNLRGFRSPVGLHQMFNEVTMTQQRGRMTEAVTEARMQSAFSRLGRAGPIRRIADELQRGGGGEPFGEVLGRVLGGIDKDVLQKLEDGPMGAIRDLQQAFGRAERYTEGTALRAIAEEEAARKRGLSLTDYRERVDKADRDKEIQQRVDDEAFRKQVDDQVRARVGNLTERGVQQRNVMSSIVEGMMEGGPAADRAKQELADFLGTDVAGIEQNLKGRLADKKLTGTARDRLEAIQRGYTAIQEGKVIPDLLRNLGVAEGQQISSGEVSGLAELGSDTQKRLSGLKPPAADADKATRDRHAKDRQDAQDAAGRFLQQSRDTAAALMGSVKDMQQLGAGGMEMLRDMRREQGAIDALAAEADVTPAQLLAGDVPAAHRDKVAQARKHMGMITGQLDKIGKIKDTGVMPGVGTRKGDQKLGARELAVVEETAKFVDPGRYAAQLDPKQFKSADERMAKVKQMQAAAVTKQLADEMGGQTRSTIVDAGGKITASGMELMKSIQEGDRSGAIFQALQARKQLAEIEEAGGDMTTAEAKRLKKLAAPLEGIGKDANLQEIRERVEKFAGVSRETGAPGGQQQKVAMTMSGDLKITEDGRAKLTGEGHGDLAHNDVFTNLVGAPGYGERMV